MKYFQVKTHKKREPQRRFSSWTSQGLNLGPPDYELLKFAFFKF